MFLMWKMLKAENEKLKAENSEYVQMIVDQKIAAVEIRERCDALIEALEKFERIRGR